MAKGEAKADAKRGGASGGTAAKAPCAHAAASEADAAPGAPRPEICLWCKKGDYTLHYGPRMLLTCDMCLVRARAQTRVCARVAGVSAVFSSRARGFRARDDTTSRQRATRDARRASRR